MSPERWALGCARFAIMALLVTMAAPHALPVPVTAQVSSPSGATQFHWSFGYSMIQHPIPVARAQPWSITTDPAGRVWFVEQGANMLGEYDPASGGFTQYQIPTPGSTPDAVASDRFGNVWFVELTADNLGELRAGSPAVVERPIPGLQVALGASTQSIPCGPGAVLADPSGGVWIACLFSNQIDEFNPAQGTFSRYDLPVFQSAPAGMALDGKGDLWFTAADANMLGKAVLSELQNGTSNGITEFAPRNQTYLYTFNHPTSFTGSTDVIRSSIPTPSGIALGPSGKLWVTEHVDSSFDSYNPTTQSLVRYWNSQTFDAYGYSVTFPNGIAVDPNGTVWIGEHYGNRVARFDPGSGAMTEYPVPCCRSSIAGVYSVALAPDGQLWFVEIGGGAIGEVKRLETGPTMALSLPGAALSVGPGGKVSIPLEFSQASDNTTRLSLSLSGISATGALQNLTATFGNSTLLLAPGGHADTDLSLSLQGLNPGVYYLTLGATTGAGVVYSAIVKLSVTSATAFPLWTAIPVAVGGVAIAIVAGLIFARRSQGGRVRRRTRSLRLPLTRRSVRATTPRPAAAYTEYRRGRAVPGCGTTISA